MDLCRDSSRVNGNCFVWNIFTTEINTCNVDEYVCEVIHTRETVVLSVVCVHYIMGPSNILTFPVKLVLQAIHVSVQVNKPELL